MLRAALADYTSEVQAVSDANASPALTADADFLYASNNYPQAVDAYTEILRTGKSNYKAYLRRAYCRQKLGFLKDAIADYTQAILLDATQSVAYHNRGVAYVALHEDAKGTADFQQANALQSTHSISATNVAPPSSVSSPLCAENGSCYGDISEATGRGKTVSVSGYTRADGTYVRGHYRSAPRRH